MQQYGPQNLNIEGMCTCTAQKGCKGCKGAQTLLKHSTPFKKIGLATLLMYNTDMIAEALLY